MALTGLLVWVCPDGAGAVSVRGHGSSSPCDPSGGALVVVNVSGATPTLVPLWMSIAGVVNGQECAEDRIFLAGMGDDDVDQAHLAYVSSAYSLGPVISLQDPWQLLGRQSVHDAVVLCGDKDSPVALHAAMSAASAAGGSAAVCASAKDAGRLLQSGMMQLGLNLTGRFPGTMAISAAAQAINAYAGALLAGPAKANLSSTWFAAWPADGSGVPTIGYDFVASQRMVMFALDPRAPDWNHTQVPLLRHFAPLSAGFGWWTKESDTSVLASLGLTWQGGGHNVALYSSLPALDGQPQPSKPDSALPSAPPGTCIAVLSFSQGDSESFNQKVNIRNLLANSTVDPSKRVSQRVSFSMMQSALDSTLQACPGVPGTHPNVALLGRQLGADDVFFTGKPYGYAPPSPLSAGGYLPRYLSLGAAAMARSGYLDMMVNEPPSPSLNATVTTIARTMQPPPRSIIVKHPLMSPSPGHAVEPVLQIGRTLVLSDPVIAPTDPKTGDLDPKATAAAILKSCQARLFLWVFLGHTATSTSLEAAIDLLPPAK
eukprot:gene1615-2849_t